MWVLQVESTHPRQQEVAAAARSSACVSEQEFLHVYDVEEGANGALVIVREWVPGSSLVDRLADGPMPADEACTLGISVARALAAAHAMGVTHDALGPGDIVITEDGRIKIGGLGVRSALQPPDRPRSDSWAVAAVTYAAATGRWPIGSRDRLAGATENDPAPRPRQVRAGVPRSLDAALAQALQEPPEDPWDVGLTLDRVRIGLGRRATDDHSDRQGQRAGRRWRRFFSVAAVVALVAAAAIGYQLISPSGPSASAPSASPSTDPTATPSPTTPSTTPTTDTSGRIPVVDGTDFDPAGNGEESPDLVPLAYDGNLATAWRTVLYQQQDLAPKPGVGVVFDLGSVQNLGAVRLNLVGAGTTLEVRVSETLGTRRKDFTLYGSGRNVGQIVALRSPAPVPARYILVWLKGLPSNGDTYRGGIAEITAARA